jgi:predicted phage baseplate assembly protein
MSIALDPSLRNLTACGCGQGIAVRTPVRIDNRPGLSALVCRVGTHARFKQTLLARLSAADQPALHALTTREDDDFTIGLLDAWSAVADVLTFYQERLANEAYLRTATERLSVLELARLIGYQLDPGVAASVALAFEIESSSGAFGQALASASTVQAPTQRAPTVTIDAGVKAQSIPGPGESAQTFETIEALEAHADHNAISPRLTQPQTLQTEVAFLILEGVALNLTAGDLILIVKDGSTPTTYRVRRVRIDNDTQTTRVEFGDTDAPLPSLDLWQASPVALDTFLEENQAAMGEGTIPLSAAIVETILKQRWKVEDLKALIELQSWDQEQFLRNLREQAGEWEAGGKVYVFRQRTKVFGYNAPKQVTYTEGVPAAPWDWVDWDVEAGGGGQDAEANDRLFLAEASRKVVPGSYAVVIRAGIERPGVYTVQAAQVRPRTAFGLSAETTRLTLDGEWWDIEEDEMDVLRTTTVYAESEELELAALPVEDEIKAKAVEAATEADGGTSAESSLRSVVMLDRAYLGLKTGQTVILTGTRTDLEGVETSEALTIKQAWLEKGFTVVEFEENLVGTYQRSTVRINANVAAATHGETVQETLGSGDGSQAFQRFTLKHTPLTHVTAATTSGRQSTLEVRVNQVLWEEVSSFHGQSPGARVYVTQLTDDGKTTVVFGDGLRGARLPTGQENVTAKYRKGIGLGGLVKAGQLSQLMTRPLGVKSAVNPLASSGAEDADTLDQARRNAPITVLTLDRIVSLQDYQDFARNFAGIEKALATWVWFGQTRGVFLTVAGPEGAAVSDTSATYANLVAAIGKYGDPRVPSMVHSHQPRLFRVKGLVKLKPDYLAETVEPLIEEALRKRFSFDEREFGQAVALSEIVAVIHGVEGVSWVDLDALHFSDAAVAWNAILGAKVPDARDAAPLPAELLTLDPRPLELEVSL